jgi:hypothetical protein
MQAARIYAEDWEVAARLQPFGVTREELIRVVQEVVAARADAVDDDPLGAAGQFAYIYGTRHLRGLLRPKKWLRYREENIEAVRHPDRNLKIVYQSVDFAALRSHEPRAVSGKGAGADRVIDSAQGRLFTDDELDRLNPSTIKAINTGIWFFCVSVDGDNICAELSLPHSIGGRNFRRFLERIFIVKSGEWPSLKVVPGTPDDIFEVEPKITRK